jgi:hypothetical protein
VHGDVLLVERRHELLSELPKSRSEAAKAAPAAATTNQRKRTAASSSGSYARLAQRTTTFSFSAILPLSTQHAIAGTKVSESARRP